jgi:hypothetical protein
MNHLSDEELIEFHYFGEGEAEGHLRTCPGCNGRYESLRRRLTAAAAEEMAGATDRPDTFWARQRFSVMRRIAAGAPETSLPARTQRWAVAAAAMVLVSSFLLYRSSASSVLPTVAPVATVAAAPTPRTAENPAGEVFQEIRALNDPWESDELKPFRGAVEWESWTEPETETEDTL